MEIIALSVICLSLVGYAVYKDWVGNKVVLKALDSVTQGSLQMAAGLDSIAGGVSYEKEPTAEDVLKREEEKLLQDYPDLKPHLEEAKAKIGLDTEEVLFSGKGNDDGNAS